MKNENGISLIKMSIIAIICLFIIVVTFITFKEIQEKIILKEYIAKMEILQEKVNSVRNNYKLWEKYNPNEVGNFYSYLQSLEFVNANSSSNTYVTEFNNIIEKLNKSNLKYWNSNADSIITNYCYFTPEDLEKSFGLKEFKDFVIINFYTGNIISKEGIKDSRNIIYRQYDSKSGNKLYVSKIYNNEVKPNIEMLENNGLSQKVKISLCNSETTDTADILEIYYYLDNSDEVLKKCSSLKDYVYIKNEKSAYFTIDISGKYSFIVEDINFVDYPKIEQEFNLCNSPILLDNMVGIYWDENGDEKEIESNKDSNWYNYSSTELKMANAKTDDGNYWVWIPRFLYQKTLEGINIEFVNKNTKISTKNKVTNGYKVQEAFYQNDELTGFWVAKFQINSEKEDIISIKPGETLTMLTAREAKKKCLKLNKNGNNFNLMSENERNAILLLSSSNEIEITNDLVHYAGGSPNEDGYKSNLKYSSTNNIYGVFDLITPENEIVREAEENEEGRYRATIVVK